MRDDGRGYLTEEAIRTGWAEDLSRMPGPDAHVNHVKKQLVLGSRLLDVMMDGAAALGDGQGLRGKHKHGKT